MSHKNVLEPEDEALSKLELRALFLEEIANRANGGVDELFNQLFSVFQQHYRYCRHFKLTDLDRDVLKPRDSILFGGGLGLVEAPPWVLDQSGLGVFHHRARSCIWGWCVRHSIKQQWCFSFAYKVANQFWADCMHPWRGDINYPLIAFANKYSRREHLTFWQKEVEEMKKTASEPPRLHPSNEEYAKMRSGQSVALLPVSPPFQFPARDKDWEFLPRSAYEEAVKDALKWEVFKWQAGNIPVEECQNVAALLFELRRWQFDEYCEATEQHVQVARGWTPPKERIETAKHIAWTVRVVVKKHSYEEIAKETGKSKGRRSPKTLKNTEEKAIRMAVKRILDDLGLPPDAAFPTQVTKTSRQGTSWKVLE